MQVISPSVRNQTVSKNAVQVCRTPLIAGVWQTQLELIGQVLGDPLHQLDRKKLQKGVVSAVGILEGLLILLVGS